jgi:Ni,Fe-hydrogenase maturation factor
MTSAEARTVVAGVGYRNLCDHSLGLVLSDELASIANPPALLVEDLSYGPVAVAQWFADEARVDPIKRAVFVSAIERGDGRPPGTVSVYRWDRVLPEPGEIQRAVTDAVTGVILLDNTLIVSAWMDALPAETIVVEVEPLKHEFGDDMSDSVIAAYDDVKRIVVHVATDAAAAHAFPVAPLGGGWVSTAVWRVPG